MQRFAVLHHQPNPETTCEEEHWDVMLETDTALKTWAITPQHPAGSSFACPAIPLPDHRKIYLEFEGNVAGNRGAVVRIDDGLYEQCSPQTFMLFGKTFHGTLTTANDVMTFVSN